MNAYDETEPFPGHAYQDGGHCYFHNSLIWGENLTNVSITGHGTDQRRRPGARRPDSRPYGRVFNRFDAARAPTRCRPCASATRPSRLKLCRNVLIRDITIFHGGHFAILVTGCDNLTVDNVTMDTDRDGIDIDCCRNTMVSNCRINSPERRRHLPQEHLCAGRGARHGESHASSTARSPASRRARCWMAR